MEGVTKQDALQGMFSELSVDDCSKKGHCQLCLHCRESAQSGRSCRLGELQLSLALCYCSILHSHVPVVVLPEHDLPLHLPELPHLKELSLLHLRRVH